MNGMKRMIENMTDKWNDEKDRRYNEWMEWREEYKIWLMNGEG